MLDIPRASVLFYHRIFKNDLIFGYRIPSYVSQNSNIEQNVSMNIIQNLIFTVLD